MPRSWYSIKQKLNALRMMEEETYLCKEIMEAHDFSKPIHRVRKVKFETCGIDALNELKIQRHYTKEQKIVAVCNYFDGGTTVEVLSNHQISDESILRI